MLVFRALFFGPSDGRQIGKYIQRTTDDFLPMQHGSLYTALHRLERRVPGNVEMGNGSGPQSEFKYYRLTEKSRKQFVVEQSQWKQMADASARVMWPTAEES